MNELLSNSLEYCAMRDICYCPIDFPLYKKVVIYSKGQSEVHWAHTNALPLFKRCGYSVFEV